MLSHPDTALVLLDDGRLRPNRLATTAGCTGLDFLVAEPPSLFFPARLQVEHDLRPDGWYFTGHWSKREHPDSPFDPFHVDLRLLVRLAIQAYFTNIRIDARLVHLEQVDTDTIRCALGQGLVLISHKGLVTLLAHAGVVQDAANPTIVVDRFNVVRDENQRAGFMGATHAALGPTAEHLAQSLSISSPGESVMSSAMSTNELLCDRNVGRRQRDCEKLGGLEPLERIMDRKPEVARLELNFDTDQADHSTRILED